MWLIQLYKAKNDDVIEGNVYSTNSCDRDYLTNYIDLDAYEHELNLCDNWSYSKGTLIIKKIPEGTTLMPLQNERFMVYDYSIRYDHLSTIVPILSLEYLKDGEFFIEFYVSTEIYIKFPIQDKISSESNLAISILDYIKGKSFKIGVIGSKIPKYNITFDNNCKYYYLEYGEGSGAIIVIKNPFFIVIFIPPDTNIGYFYVTLGIKPRLIADFNNYTSDRSSYDSENDKPLKINEIVSKYFDSDNKIGISYNNVDIDDDEDNFRYSLIRTLLGTFRNEITSNYYFKIEDSIGLPEISYNSYMPLDETPLCIYFPLFRPQIDSNGFAKPSPQYSPSEADKYVYYFYSVVHLEPDGSVKRSLIHISYGSSLSEIDYCTAGELGYMPAWRSATCDFTLPFRFVGNTDCNAPDEWANETIEHNANYLFRIVKPSSSSEASSVYNIKGVGCGELTEDIHNFSDFTASHELFNYIGAQGFLLAELLRINISEVGWPADAIANTLTEFGIRNGETCFVLFNESLVENIGDFETIYTLATSSLPNPIVGYIGEDEKIPNTHKNKVIHSNAIVTDLDTNEQMPLVIKYIRYAKRIYELFNR